MKKTLINSLPLFLMMAAVDSNRYRRQPNNLSLVKKPLTEKEKLNRHNTYSGDQQQHTYVICGQTIKAPNKKVARKIYARLYGHK